MTYFVKLLDFVFPVFLLMVVVFSTLNKNSFLNSFKKGALQGANTIFEIMPNIVLINVATSMFKATGALMFIVEKIAPLLMKLKIPKGLCELIIMRPISGGASIALLTNIYNALGADSYEGLIASVIAASTETTLYTISIYFGATRVKKTAIPLIVGLCADAFTVLFSVFIINMFF